MMGDATCLQCNSAVLRPGRSAYPSGPADVGPQHRMSPDQQHCTHSCRGRCQALQSSSSAPLFESPARLSRREGGAGHSISFPARLDAIARENAVGIDTIEIWFADEARIGQKNKIPRRWAPRGTRPSAPKDQRTASTYIFGAVCPKEGKGAALVLPHCHTAAMTLHLAEASRGTIGEVGDETANMPAPSGSEMNDRYYRTAVWRWLGA